MIILNYYYKIKIDINISILISNLKDILYKYHRDYIGRQYSTNAQAMGFTQRGVFVFHIFSKPNWNKL